MDGAAGAASATTLTAVALDDDNHFHVTDVTGFLTTGGILLVESEKVSYTATVAGQFTGLTRGIEGTIADGHAVGVAVYNEDAGLLNYALGFSVIQTGVPGGLASVAMMPFNFLTKTVPKLVLWDFAFLQGDFLLVRYILMSISVGFVIYLAYMVVSTIMGILRR